MLGTKVPMRTAQRLAVAALVAFSRIAAQAPAPERRVAITIDDGPVVGELKDLGNFQRISAGLMESLQAERVPATIFINERQLNVQGQRDGRAVVVAQWLDAGYDIGNHTYSHLSLNEVPLWQFEDNVIKGEVIMRPLIEERGSKLVWFRYPFLDSGTTAEVHQKFLDFLEQRHYRVAPITVDYKDYLFAGAYGRMLRAGKAEIAEKIRQAYLEQVDDGFAAAERISRDLFGYELPQILLIHCSELNSISLRGSIARMRTRGYRFVTLEEAMTDPAYARPDTFTGPGGSWLERTGDAMGKPVHDDAEGRVPKWITELRRPAAIK
jgi:peptidoglycan/xylan/chitin deacetylase (PgdA/CDA1 family)